MGGFSSIRIFREEEHFVLKVRNFVSIFCWKKDHGCVLIFRSGEGSFNRKPKVLVFSI